MAEKKPERKSAFAQANEASKQIEEIKKDGVHIIEIEIGMIDNPRFHDRSSFNEADIWSLAKNIQKTGLINPVILRAKHERFERVSGYRRIEACKKLGMTKIKAIVLDLTDEAAMLLMLSENIQRENLNAFDETISILQYISVSLDMSEEEVKSFIYKVKNYRSGNIRALDDEEKEKIETIDAILQKIGNFSYDGFINRLRLLNLEPILIEAIRKRVIQYYHAVEINKLKDPTMIAELLEKTLEEKLSVSQIKKEVAKLKNNSGGVSRGNPFKSFAKHIRNFDKIDEEKKRQIEEKMKEIYELLGVQN